MVDVKVATMDSPMAFRKADSVGKWAGMKETSWAAKTAVQKGALKAVKTASLMAESSAALLDATMVVVWVPLIGSP